VNIATREDITSARTPSTTDFDCELPPGVRAELLRPKRARMLGQPVKGPHRRPAIVLALVLVAAGAVVAFWSWQRPSVAPAMQPEATPVATPPATPAVQSAAARAWLAAAPTVRRAELVKLPTPRATLVALPEWRVGEQRRLLMPYGLEVVGRLRGHSEDELYLPASGNAIGDTWLVENTPWIWLTVPGTAAPTWVDP
jgi:hypothetical protein